MTGNNKRGGSVKSSWATNLQKSVDSKIQKKLKNKTEVT